MAGNKQAENTDDKRKITKTLEGRPVHPVPEPVSFPDTLPMPAPHERPLPEDEKPEK